MPITRSSKRQIQTKSAAVTEIQNQENRETENKPKQSARLVRRLEEEARPLLQNITNSKVASKKDAITIKVKSKKQNSITSKMRTLSREEAGAAAVEASEEIAPVAVASEKIVEQETAQKRIYNKEGNLEQAVPLDEESPTKKPKEEEKTDDKKASASEILATETNKETLPQEEAKSPTSIAANAEADKEQKPSTSLSLRAPTAQGLCGSPAGTNAEPTPPRATTRSLPDKLLSVLSNLYLNAPERLHLDFTPRCAENLSYCHQHHYRAQLPEAPTHQQAQDLRCALQQQRYVSFINLTRDICQRGEFPGEGIFTKLIELLLSLNAKTYKNKSLVHTYNKSIELFSLIVCTFPPCWLALRPFYISFFQRPLDPLKITPKNKPPLTKSTRIFDILLDLLENTLEQCSVEELHEQSFIDMHVEAEAPTTTTATTSATATANSEQHSVDMSVCSDFFNQWEWEEREHNLQTFVALSAGCRLERLFVVLRLLLQILESDLVLWILHHHKTTKDWIFREETRPLVVVVFDISMYMRFSSVVRRVFTLFASAVSKNLSRARLQIIERYIALLMVASNTADMENTVIGVKYPYLGAQTKSLIREFFKIFKAHNTATISTYLQTIDILRIPYVRYEFIDHFLQIFYFSHTEEMSPKKICYDMSKKRWLKYKPQSELTAPSSEEDLSREQYLKMLLDALRVYCEWHGSKTFLQLISFNDACDGGGDGDNSKQLKHIQTTTDSVHRWPTRGTGALVLEKIASDMQTLEQKLKLTVRMSMPKVDLPIADICIDDEIITKYRSDLKFVMILHDMLPKHISAHPEVDFSEWQTFLSDFAPPPT